MSKVEQVGVIPRSTALGLELLSHGYTPLRNTAVLNQIEESVSFMDRPEAEEDPSFKQIIPYGMLCLDESVFLMQRLTGGGEKRLHGKFSLGVGGHMNPIDSGDLALIEATMRRELDEELFVEGDLRFTACGFINDDSTPVGSVHLGVVYRIELLEGGSARVRETETLRGGFEPWQEVSAYSDRMETWSAFLVEANEAGLLSTP